MLLGPFLCSQGKDLDTDVNLDVDMDVEVPGGRQRWRTRRPQPGQGETRPSAHPRGPLKLPFIFNGI